MIFLTIMVASFVYGAVKGYRNWQVSQIQVNQSPNHYRN